MRSKISDKTIQRFFWNCPERPFNNKASYLLGDLTAYGVSRCRKLKNSLDGTIYEFDVYRDGDFRVALAVELSTDFTRKEIQERLLGLFTYGGMITSNDKQAYYSWKREIMPFYSYTHSKYSAIRFLEALRKKMLENTKIHV